jgi:hypothetical protein
VGGPEPLFAQNEAELRIWRRDRMARVVCEDLRDLEQVREISLVEQLADLLPSRVGAALSVKSLREDLEVDHKTVERWLKILENLYVGFRIPPYGAPRVRALEKERKLYLWGWSGIEDAGPRFENLVASQLLKYCHWIEDTQGHAMELRFLFAIRTGAKRISSSRRIAGRCSRRYARRGKIAQSRAAVFRRTHADPALLPGAPRRAAIRGREDHRPALRPVLPGLGASLARIFREVNERTDRGALEIGVVQAAHAAEVRAQRLRHAVRQRRHAVLFGASPSRTTI